jgi:hypothetical protein
VYVDAPLGESSWTSFLRPNSSSKPGTMPAGMVLVVVVAALILAMFLSADSINRKAASRRTNAEWRKTTSEMVANVSKTLKLDAPEKALDNAVAPYIGHERKTSDKSTSDLLAERRAAQAAAGVTVDPVPTLPGGSTVPTTTPPPTEPGAPPTTAAVAPPTTVDPRPKVRKPTPDAPLKVWFGGDSISYEPGVAFTNIAAESKLFTVTTYSKASSGLARPDFFNRPEYLDKEVVPLDGSGVQPDILFIMFGGNDGQNIPMPPPVGGYVLGSPEWQAEYRKRVGDTMDLMRSPKNDRLVIWAGMPIVAPGTVKGVDQMDYIYYTEAKKRPWVVYFDSWAFFTGPDGAFAKSLPAADGEQHVMRNLDNIHMSLLGGERLAWALHAKLGTLVDLSAAPVTGDPKQMPPPEVTERPEVPPGEGQAPAG